MSGNSDRAFTWTWVGAEICLLGMGCVVLLLYFFVTVDRLFAAPKKRAEQIRAAFMNSVHIGYNSTDNDMAQAVRYAYLALDNGTLVFRSFAQAYLFDAKPTQATCLVMSVNKHHAPAESCKCGFYSLHTIGLLQQIIEHHDNCVILEVRLWGTMIEGQRGLRAEWQTVLGVTLPIACAHFHCLEPAIAFGSSLIRGPLASRLIRTQEYGRPVNHTVPLLMPLCAKHTSKYRHSFSATDLANALQCDVRWAVSPQRSASFEQ